MDNSPLLYLCPDISNTIGEYLKTYKKKVIINKKERLIGISVYNSSKELFEDQ